MINKLASLALLVAAVGPVTGCANPPAEPVDVSLQQAVSCEDLEARLKQDALLKMNAGLDAQLAWQQQYLEGYPVPGDEESFGDVGSSASGGLGLPQDDGAPSNNDAGSKDGPAHSDTNNQVDGVNEADIVKTDGNYLYALHGRALTVMSSWPASELAVASEVAIEGRPLEMFLRDGQVVVYSAVSAEEVYGKAGKAAPQPTVDYDYYYYPTMTKVTVLSVSDTANPSVETEMYFEGQYVSARRIGSKVRTVLSGGYHLPGLSYYPEFDYDQWPTTTAQWTAAYEQLRATNTALIANASLSDFLPERFVGQADGTLASLSPSCTDYYVPRAGTAAYGLTQIQAFDLDALDQGPVETQIVGQAQQVYSSKDAMYLAGANWNNPYYFSRRFHTPVSVTSTHLHKFGLDDGQSRASYQGSGLVPGHVHDQFSMDEKDGLLRIATTDQLVSDEGGEQLNHLHVMQLDKGQLKTVGAVLGLAPGERVYSARFVGDRGYLVTYRQIDPLFVIDLSRPSEPTVTAALKIPGFSEYMHPLADGYLLTIGRDGNDDGQVLNTALQIFDVRDDQAPKLLHKHVLAEGYSEAEYSHKAFTFYAGKLAIPLVSYDYDGGGYHVSSTLELFDVDASTGIVPLGNVNHSAFFDNLSDPYCYPYQLGVRRGVFIEDYVYSISEGGVLVNPLSDLSSVIATVAFNQPELGANCYYGEGL